MAGGFGWQRLNPGFRRAISRLIYGGAFLALFLLMESGLLRLASWSLHSPDSDAEHLSEAEAVIVTVLDGIELGSALVVALVFLLHGGHVAWEYGRYLFEE